MTKTFVATVKLSGGLNQKVTVQADDPFRARKMLEAQYGAGSIVNSPTLKN